MSSRKELYGFLFTPKRRAQAGRDVFDGLFALVHHGTHTEGAMSRPVVAPDRCMIASFLQAAGVLLALVPQGGHIKMDRIGEIRG